MACQLDAARSANIACIPGARNAGHLQALSNPRRHHTLLKWSNELGPIFVLRLLWMRIVVVTEPVIINKLLQRSMESHKSPGMAQFSWVRR
jgi:hypothetical protein